jgi:DNA-binding LacI/PurR family transcriptional regulator
MNRYKASYRTVRRALHALCESGLIERYGRGFKIRSTPGSGRRRQRVVLIDYGTPKSDRLNFFASLDADILRLLEWECARNGVWLDIYIVSHEGSELSFRKAGNTGVSTLADAHDVLGYIYLSKISHAPHIDILHTLAQRGKPVAILDRIGDWELPGFALSSALVKVFRSSLSKQAAHDVARFCIERDRKTIAYISPYHLGYWSKTRYKGLETVMQQAGFEGVRLYAAESLLKSGDFYNESIKRYDSAPLLKAYNAWRKKAPRRYIHSARKWGSRDYVEDGLFSLHVESELYKQCRPLFEAAAKRKEITAWILANDSVTDLALDFCIERGIKVPQELWLIGFDDSALALQRRLTSYCFNTFGLVQSMLNHLLRPATFGKLARMKHVEIEGMIVERDTTL